MKNYWYKPSASSADWTENPHLDIIIMLTIAWIQLAVDIQHWKYISLCIYM